MSEHFGVFTPGRWKAEHIIRFGPYLPILGWTRVDIHDSRFLAEHAGGEVYYRPLPFQNESNYLSFSHIANLPFDQQRDRWLAACVKDGIPLARVLDDMRANGKRPIIPLFNEPTDILNDPEIFVRYDEFSYEMSRFLGGQMGATAAIWGGGTGWLHEYFIEGMQGILEATNKIHGWCYLEYHRYTPIGPHVWMGANQSHGLTGDEDEATKWEYITRHDWSQPITSKTELVPAWLGERIWGIANDDGSYGLPALWDCDLLIGEGVVDRIPDVGSSGKSRLPKEGGGTWYENRFILMREMGIQEHEAGVACLRAVDDTLARLRNYGAPTLRMAFCVGPGWGWDNYDFWRDEKHLDAFMGYLTEDVPLPPAMSLEDELPPNGNGPPPNGNGEPSGCLPEKAAAIVEWFRAFPL
jgi:hypothetical protein